MAPNLDGLFRPESIAIIGASDKPEKIGFVILNNLINLGYGGKIYPVNPKHDEILELKCYKSIKEIGKKIGLAIIVTPPETVPGIIGELGEKGVKFVVIVSGGFGEVNNQDLKDRLIEICKKYKMNVVGPNCLGISYSKGNLDTIFFPIHKLRRPGYGGVSLVTQSGGVGSSLMAIASSMGIGINKFVSYGNSYILDEADFINYLAEDNETKSIVVYIEGTSDGKKFMDSLVNANQKKPVIVLKAGKEGMAQDAVKSHTGAMAGSYMAYRAAFKKAKVIEAETMNELFDFISVSSQSLPKGKRVGIISNGGGFGVMAADSVLKNGLDLPRMSDKMKREISSFLPSYASAGNPLDLVADADVERFSKSIDVFMRSDEFDMVLVSVLFQTPMINETLLSPLVNAGHDWRKPVALVVPGGDEVEAFKKITSMNKVPTFDIPERAVVSLRSLYEYSKFRGIAKD
jgi:acetyl coenzyme A synthetase (ADP forming)-like protein